MRLTLVIHSLECGGAQRVLTTLANAWQRTGHTVTVAALSDGQRPPFFALDDDISIEWLDMAGDSRHVLDAIARNTRRVWAVRVALVRTRPNLVVSFLTTVNVLVLLATMTCAVPVIVSERIDPRLDPLPRVWRWLRRRLYRRAAAIVVQTRRTAEWFPPQLRSRMAVIPNAVSPPRTPPRPTRGRNDHPTVLGVGRLEPQKGFDLLVRAFAHAIRQHDGWELVIVGEGSQRPALAALAAAYGVADRVHIPGRQLDIWRAYAAADIFVLPSRFEGFPNVLLEAMAAGLPSVAADCPTGPREIIRNEREGLLVPTEDVDAFAEALSRLMGNAALRDRLGSEAARVVDRYGADAIQERWSALVSDVAGRVGRR